MPGTILFNRVFEKKHRGYRKPKVQAKCTNGCTGARPSEPEFGADFLNIPFKDVA